MNLKCTHKNFDLSKIWAKYLIIGQRSVNSFQTMSMKFYFIVTECINKNVLCHWKHFKAMVLNLFSTTPHLNIFCFMSPLFK